MPRALVSVQRWTAPSSVLPNGSEEIDATPWLDGAAVASVGPVSARAIGMRR